MIIAKIRVNGAIAKTVYRKVIPAGIIGAQVEFDYDEDIWHELHKTVVFKGAVTKDVVTDANIVTIPHEVVEKPFFQLSIGVYGVNADGNIVIPTLWEDIGDILDATTPSGDANTDQSPPVWAQIQAMIGNLDELETTARDNLVAAVNEVAQSVGDASITMRVDGGFIQYSTDNGKTWVNLIAESDLKGDKGDKGDTGSAGAAGKDGKSAYQYAQDGGYTGTETEFAKKLASGVLIVTITDSNGTLSKDKSYIEIRDAIIAGTPVLVAYDGIGLPLIALSADTLTFGAIQCANDETGAIVGTSMIEITENGEVHDISAYVETLPNPNAITFTGAVTGSYDGSAGMTVNIPTAVTDSHINSLIDTKLGVIENGSY